MTTWTPANATAESWLTGSDLLTDQGAPILTSDGEAIQASVAASDRWTAAAPSSETWS